MNIGSEDKSFTFRSSSPDGLNHNIDKLTKRIAAEKNIFKKIQHFIGFSTEAKALKELKSFRNIQEKLAACHEVLKKHDEENKSKSWHETDDMVAATGPIDDLVSAITSLGEELEACVRLEKGQKIRF